ncbi:disease resistance RPP13-like protein 4-like protein, partial [Corchorus capsularis]
MASLQLSYDELPTRLKQCLLCFSIYPEDSVISAEQLVHWWVGEGFVQGKDTRTAIELAFDYLSELISRCLVEVVKQRGFDGRVYSCKMHDLVRDLTIKIAREEEFCSFDEHGRQRPTIRSRRLGFKDEEDVKSLNKKSKLRAFLMMSSSPVSLDRTSPLFRVKSIRGLDFSQNKLENIPIQKLMHWISSLAYLNLRGVATLKELPQFIGELRNLQLLVLTGCNNLQKLPLSITNLQKLTVLDIGYCPIQYLPQGLGRLSNLQELSGFKVPSSENRNGCRLGELQGLSQLKVLRVNISEESDIAEDELTVMSKLKQLK